MSIHGQQIWNMPVTSGMNHILRLEHSPDSNHGLRPYDSEPGLDLHVRPPRHATKAFELDFHLKPLQGQRFHPSGLQVSNRPILCLIMALLHISSLHHYPNFMTGFHYDKTVKVTAIEGDYINE